MNIVFFGSSSFGIPSLKALVEAGHTVSCVVTQPDRKKGRGLGLSLTSIKSTATALRIKTFQPENVNEKASVAFIRAINADLFVVIAYGQMLGNELLSVPRHMAINLHGSLLPHYRGAAPIQWAIINGDTISGVSVMKLIKKLDAGPLLLCESIELQPQDTVESLGERLSYLGATVLCKAVTQIQTATFTLKPQDEQKVSYAPKLTKEDGLIDWDKPAIQIERLVRGCGKWPGAYTVYKGKTLKIHKVCVCLTTLHFAPYVPGEIIEVSKQGLSVSTGEGIVRIEALQLEGKRFMQAHEFIAGHKVSPKEVLGKNSCAQ